MAEESYRLVFRGQLVEGVSRAEAEANLKSRFKYSDSALAKLFTGKGVVLKGGMDQVTAEKYEKALAGVGLVCEVLPPSVVEVAEPEKPAPVEQPTPAPAAPPVQENPFAEPEPPAEDAAVVFEPAVEAGAVEVESAPVQAEAEEPGRAQPAEYSDVPEDVFGSESDEYAPVAEEIEEDAGAQPSVTWDGTENVFEPDSVELTPAQEEVEGSAASPQPAAWDEAENVFESDSVELASIQDQTEESVVAQQPESWDAAENAFEPESEESTSIQEEIEEAAVAQQPEDWDESDDLFGSDSVAPAQVQGGADEFVAQQEPEVPNESEDFFEAKDAPTTSGPEAAFFKEFPAAASPVSAAILDVLKQTKPWVRLISVLLFVGPAFGLLAVAAVLLGGVLGGLGNNADAPMMLMLLPQMLILLIYLIPAYYLFKYASAIGTLLKGGGESDLEAALGYQKSFWRFLGILTLVCLVLGVLGGLAAVLIPAMIG